MPHRTHPLFDLTGKTALMGGGSHGLRLQMRHALGDADARLRACARDANAVQAACVDLQADGRDARCVAADGAAAAILQNLVSEPLQRLYASVCLQH